MGFRPRNNSSGSIADAMIIFLSVIKQMGHPPLSVSPESKFTAENFVAVEELTPKWRDISSQKQKGILRKTSAGGFQ
jgi:hypothetical protein